MILTKKVKIRMEGKNFKIYKSKGYIFKWREIIDINIEDVLLNSNVIISAKCDICGNLKIIQYNFYNKNLSRGGFYSCQKCSTLKRKTKCLLLFGVDNYIKTKEYIDNLKKICIDKYGVDNFFKSSVFKEKRMKSILLKYGTNNFQKCLEVRNKTMKTCIEKYGVEYSGNLNRNHNTSEFKDYKRICRNITNSNKKMLYINWDGFDYYDGEYIKEHKSLNFNDNKYPTIDHKLSVYYGFVNNISPEIICNLDNLCITKRILNSKKNKYVNV